MLSPWSKQAQESPPEKSVRFAPGTDLLEELEEDLPFYNTVSRRQQDQSEVDAENVNDTEIFRAYCTGRPRGH